MGIFKAIGDFLFGKDPAIFDKRGRVRHTFPEQKWKAWDQRIRDSSEYDWRDHAGRHLAATPPGPSGSPREGEPSARSGNAEKTTSSSPNQTPGSPGKH